MPTIEAAEAAIYRNRDHAIKTVKDGIENVRNDLKKAYEDLEKAREKVKDLEDKLHKKINRKRWYRELKERDLQELRQQR
ncbi:MAG: hypothetical protein Q9222_001017 [Ikaeria aurantiellina]